MNDKPKPQGKCIDVNGNEAIFKRLASLAYETSSKASDPCEVMFSWFGNGVDVLKDLVKACEGWQFDLTKKEAVITHERERKAGLGGSQQVKFKAVDMKWNLGFMITQGNDVRNVDEPLATERNTQELSKFLWEQKKEERPCRYIVNMFGSLKYLPLLLSRCPFITVLNFKPSDMMLLEGAEPGEHPHQDAVEGRKPDYTFSTLPEDEEEDVMEHLLAKFALTMMPAPSYSGKTHTAISQGLALVTGENWLGKFKVPEKVRVRYFVPELSAGRFKKFMLRIAPAEVWEQHEEDFIVRPLDCDLLMLDSPEMIEKCKCFYVFLDTLGYFMGLDDANSYAAAIQFANRVNHLIREGCLGVCGLYHPPKYSKNKKETGNILTLENQILGSAGFGGLLRSCIALRNLNQDSNDGLWCYVQGLKNPGLGKPFQIRGFPMEYIGESPYLSELLKSGSKKDQALAMAAEGKGRREICKVLGISPNQLTKWKQQEEELEQELEADQLEFNPDQGEEL